MGLAARAGLSAEEQLDPAEGSDSVCLSDGQLLLKGCLPRPDPLVDVWSG